MGNYLVIENIHQKVYEAASARPDALNMGEWHTCDTIHCRAGWVVHLAGEAGAKLERQTSTLFAAMQIYKASSPIAVSPTRFYASNEVALADMKRCAEEEVNPALKESVTNTMIKDPNAPQANQEQAINEQATQESAKAEATADTQEQATDETGNAVAAE